MATKFYYFGFGSNMLSKRIHIQNPGAIRIGPGKLENYRLDFYGTSHTWQGAPATIIPSQGDIVYGAIWQVDCCHIKDLDKQEGVHLGIYKPLAINVQLIKADNPHDIECRTYQLCCQPITDIRSFSPDQIPYDRQPSYTYLKTLIKGAKETGLPNNYIDYLKNIKHNDNIVENFEYFYDTTEFNRDLHNFEYL